MKYARLFPSCRSWAQLGGQIYFLLPTTTLMLNTTNLSYTILQLRITNGAVGNLFLKKRNRNTVPCGSRCFRDRPLASCRLGVACLPHLLQAAKGLLKEEIDEFLGEFLLLELLIISLFLQDFFFFRFFLPETLSGSPQRGDTETLHKKLNQGRTFGG